jgi:ABC-type oligopeptide transport system ATPase subunit
MMNLLKDIQRIEQVAYLLVAHDLATVRHMADQVAVMYMGQIVELAPTEKLFEETRHPYTKALLSAVLPDHPDHRGEEIVLSGEVPSPYGCAARLPLPHPLSLRETRVRRKGADVA